MNKIFKKKNLLEDEFLNNKIEKIFENKLFQNLVEKTDVLKDEDLSLSQSNFQNINILNQSILENLKKNFLDENTDKKSDKILKENANFKKQKSDE